MEKNFNKKNIYNKRTFCDSTTFMSIQKKKTFTVSTKFMPVFFEATVQ